MAIDVGAPCAEHIPFSPDYCVIAKENPANATGTIDAICIYSNIFSAVQIGSFTDEGGNVLSSRADSGDMGAGAAGENNFSAPGDFTAFAIEAGDYIGGHINNSIDYSSSSVNGGWYKDTNEFPYASVEFTYHSGYGDFSIYATGTEAGAGAAPTGGLYGSLVGPFGGPIGPMGGRL